MGTRVVLDANVIVGSLDVRDSQHERARAVMELLTVNDAEIVLVDFLVSEAVTVLVRRASERRRFPEPLGPLLATTRSWAPIIRSLAKEAGRLWHQVHDIIEATGGALNFNDSLLVALQAEGHLGEVATFDKALLRLPGFKHFGP